MIVRNDRLLKRWNDHLLKRWNGHLLKCERRVLMLIDCLYLWDLSLRLHVLTIWRWFLIEMLMTDTFFFKKIWSNKCVWESINGFRWRKKMIKWMWCCYQTMKQASCWFDVKTLLHLMPMPSDALAVECDVRHAASGRKTVRCTLAIVLMSGLLHLMLKSSNALTKLSDCQTAAFDRETIKCTLTIVCDKSSLQLADCNVIRDDVEILHSMLRPSNALTILSVFSKCWGSTIVC